MVKKPNILQRAAIKYLIPPDYQMKPIQEKRANNLPINIARNWFAYGIPLREQLDPVFKPLTAPTQYVKPRIPYTKMIDAYENDSEISFGLDWINAVSVGIGHYFTAVNSRVEDYINEFAANIDLDSILIKAGLETLGYGDSFWRYRDLYADPKSFDIIEQMPLTSFRYAWWNDQTNQLSHYEFRGTTTLNLLPAEVIHFSWRNSNASPLGLGLLAPLVQRVAYTLYKNNEPETRIRASILDIKRSIQDSSHKFIKRIMPRTLFELSEASPDQRADAEKTLASLDDEEDIVVDGPTKATQLMPRIQIIDNETFERLYSNEIIKAIGTPTSRLFEKGALTEASSKTAKEVAMMNLAGFQRRMKRLTERLIIKPWYMANPIADANGVSIPWELAHARLNWGLQEKPKVDAEMVQAIVGLITNRPLLMDDEEIRDNFRNWGVQLKSKEESGEEIEDGTT